jgi:hypothetical protein
VSTVFSAHFSDHIIMPSNEDSNYSSLDTPSDGPASAASMGTATVFSPGSTPPEDKGEDTEAVIRALREQILSMRKAWEGQIWELEGQVRDLKGEVAELRAVGSNKDFCEVCGRGVVGARSAPADAVKSGEDGRREGVLNRPRARTGVGSRFGGNRDMD